MKNKAVIMVVVGLVALVAVYFLFFRKKGSESSYNGGLPFPGESGYDGGLPFPGESEFAAPPTRPTRPTGNPPGDKPRKYSPYASVSGN
jgi:hypothetical protein